MAFLGLGRKYKFPIGTEIKYIGTNELDKKILKDEVLIVKDRKNESGKDWYGCRLSTGARFWFTESIIEKVAKRKAKGMSGLGGNNKTLKYQLGTKLKYTGSDKENRKLYGGKVLTVEMRDSTEDGNWYKCYIGKSRLLIWFLESVVTKIQS